MNTNLQKTEKRRSVSWKSAPKVSMKKKFLCINFTVVALVLFSTVMVCCKKESPKGEIPNVTSSYWGDDYRRFQFHNKVKTATEFRNETELENGNYYLYQFNQNGCLIEQGKYYNNSFSNGNRFKHNAQKFLTVFEYYDNGKLSEICNYNYGGKNSHNAYIPSNFTANDIGLQKGITGLHYQSASGESYIKLDCIAVKESKLFFSFTWDKNQGEMILTTKGGYPIKLEIDNGEKIETVADILFGEDGIPKRITVLGSKDISVGDFIVKSGFCVLTSEETIEISTGNVTNSKKYTYNDKGFLASEQRNNGEIISYTYDYDNFGNWTKKESSKGVIVYRKYTYYN
jgi:hypothetical protein